MPKKALATAQTGAIYLELDGQLFPLVTCTLPDIVWDIAEQSAGAAVGLVRPGVLKLGDLAIGFAPGQMPALAGWVDEIMVGKVMRLDMSVVRTDMNGKSRERIELKGCFPVELRFPQCDAAGKSAYLVEAIFRPESIAGGAAGESVKPGVSGKQKKMLASNFVVSVGDLPTGRVVRVAAFTLRRNPGSEVAGELRRPSIAGGLGRCSPLSLVVGGADYQAWRDFALQQVARGPVGKEIEARLELRDTSLKKVLASFDFRLAGLSGFRFEPIAQGIEAALETATASFSVDAVALKLAGG